MFIKEICLEGFKSYATRTVVPGFDPLFNAITGLNGSGKSNILDSICFVLGITNLQQVRASNLQELVYKQGQAGVTKATVSVLFDNSDSSHSPIGYEDCAEITVTRQIVVGGRNKYMINGHLAQPNRVQNLFHSVQLNVNNPHFLIMQGRITKVLNMKPPETLSMLEEAAGTRMYENKKEAALKTLEKKQSKVDEIDNVLAQELLPALEKLRKERAVYMEWSHNKEEIRNLQRFCIAYDFVEAEKVKNTAVGEVEQLKNGIGQQKEQMVQLQEEVAEKEGAISALRQQKEMVTTENLKQLIDKVDKVSKALVKETCAFDNLNEALDTEKASQQQLERTMADLEQAVAEKTSGFQRADDSVSGLKEKVDTLVKNSAQLEGELQGVRLGKSGHGADKSLADQLADAKAAASRAENEIQQARTKTHHLERELKDKKEHLLSKENEARALTRELEARKDEVGNLKVALQDVGYREGSMETLEKARMEKTEAVQKLKQEISELSGRLGGVQFSYDNPTRDFDRHRVKGVVARLFHVKDAKAMTALEVAAGGKLFQVVVDNEVTGKLLFEKGGLRRRVTIIPLNKIQGNTINHRAQSAADKVVGYGNAKVALSLIGYDEELQAAMAYVFGGSFVCSDSDTAKQVAFHRDIRVTSVTLEGDVFQPSGLLTGGSRNGGGELLMRLHALAEAEHKLAILLQKLADIEQQVSSLLPLHRQYSSMKAQLELKTYDLTLCETRATQSEHHKLNELVQAMELQLEREVLEASTKEQHHTDCLELLATIQQSINEHGRDRDTRISSLEIKIKAVKLELAAAVKELKAMESTRERLLMENEAAVQEKLSLATQLSSMQANIEALTVQRSTLSSKIEVLKNEYDRIQDEISESRSQIEECDTEISSMSRSLSRLQQSMTDCSLNIKKIENQVKRMEEAHNVSAKTVDDLLKKHDWISSEKQFFGKPGTAYDFSVRNPVQAKEQLESRRTEQEKVEKMINKKAMNMFQKAEEDYNELMKKKGIIENDKQKIQSVIRELDEKKKEALEVTWQKVNKDFGSIFSTLLPGTTAKLEPPEGGDFLEGLEVRVAFGGVWKQSLSELSGGQRSLLALSLILSLLLFKPAPLYILDEVDAALDLSHTQNIGRMIKSHFPQSQFIVVSLKEGMFTNANVIFRTKFVDGVSTVTRTVPGR